MIRRIALTLAGAGLLGVMLFLSSANTTSAAKLLDTATPTPTSYFFYGEWSPLYLDSTICMNCQEEWTGGDYFVDVPPGAVFVGAIHQIDESQALGAYVDSRYTYGDSGVYVATHSDPEGCLSVSETYYAPLDITIPAGACSELYGEAGVTMFSGYITHTDFYAHVGGWVNAATLFEENIIAGGKFRPIFYGVQPESPTSTPTTESTSAPTSPPSTQFCLTATPVPSRTTVPTTTPNGQATTTRTPTPTGTLPTSTPTTNPNATATSTQTGADGVEYFNGGYGKWNLNASNTMNGGINQASYDSTTSATYLGHGQDPNSGAVRMTYKSAVARVANVRADYEIAFWYKVQVYSIVKLWARIPVTSTGGPTPTPSPTPDYGIPIQPCDVCPGDVTYYWKELSTATSDGLVAGYNNAEPNVWKFATLRVPSWVNETSAIALVITPTEGITNTAVIWVDEIFIRRVQSGGGGGSDSYPTGYVPVCPNGSSSSGGPILPVTRECKVAKKTVDVLKQCVAPASLLDVGGYISWLGCRIYVYFNFQKENTAAVTEFRSRYNNAEPFGSLLEMGSVLDLINNRFKDLPAAPSIFTVNWASLYDLSQITSVKINYPPNEDPQMQRDCGIILAGASDGASRAICFIVSHVKVDTPFFFPVMNLWINTIAITSLLLYVRRWMKASEGA